MWHSIRGSVHESQSSIVFDLNCLMKQQYFQDYEEEKQYQMHSFFLFLDPKSLERIPESGYTFHVPIHVKDRPGGPGLDEIKHFLKPTVRDESFEFTQSARPAGGRVISAHLMVAGMLFIIPLTFAFTKRGKNSYTIEKNYFPPTPNYQVSNLTANIELAKAFLSWRGFHKLEPIQVSKNIVEGDWFGKPVWEQVRMRAALQYCSDLTGLRNPAVLTPTTHKNDGKVSGSSPASTSKDSSESSSPATNENNGKVSNSSPASMDLPESSSPTTENIPISNESTSKSKQSHSLRAQPHSQSPPEPTQLPPEPTEPSILPPGQLTLEQKKTMQKQMSRAKQLVSKTKQPAGKKAKKSKKEPDENPKDQIPSEEPSEPESKGIVASFWKILGR